LVGVTLREKMGGRGRGGMNFGVVATVCCEGGSRCFAVVVAMAELGVYGIAGESVCDLYGIFRQRQEPVTMGGSLVAIA